MDKDASPAGDPAPTLEVMPGVVRRTLRTGTEGQLVEFRVAADAVVPAHPHTNEQLGYVVSGPFEMTIGGQSQVLVAGGSYRVPPDVTHVGRAIEDAVVIDVFVPPREDYR